MYLDEQLYASGGGEHGRSCRACKGPILQGQHTTRVEFENDPAGVNDLTGDYHAACSKPFASMARALKAMGRFGH
jgi:hypothetical protein